MTKESRRLPIASRLNNAAGRGSRCAASMSSTQLGADDGEDSEQERGGERLLISIETKARLARFHRHDDTRDNQELAEKRDQRANDAERRSPIRQRPREQQHVGKN